MSSISLMTMSLGVRFRPPPKRFRLTGRTKPCAADAGCCVAQMLSNHWAPADTYLTCAKEIAKQPFRGRFRDCSRQQGNPGFAFERCLNGVVLAPQSRAEPSAPMMLGDCGAKTTPFRQRSKAKPGFPCCLEQSRKRPRNGCFAISFAHVRYVSAGAQ